MRGLAGQGKRPAAARAGVNVKTAARYIRAAQEAGLARDGGDVQLTDDLLGQVVEFTGASFPREIQVLSRESVSR